MLVRTTRISMNAHDPDKVIMTVAEFLTGAHSNELADDNANEDAREIKDSKARRDEEWSVLANQVVGGEAAVFPNQRASRQSGDSTSSPSK